MLELPPVSTAAKDIRDYLEIEEEDEKKIS